MPDVKSCGVLVFDGRLEPSFLLMRHADRWDLPKGHVDPGETELECALRELVEETGIERGDVDIDTEFRFVHEYRIIKDRGKPVDKLKQLIIFLGRLKNAERERPEILLTEHLGYEWFPWAPPHRIQETTIDPLLASVADFFQAD